MNNDLIDRKSAVDKWCEINCGCLRAECPLTYERDGCEACVFVEFLENLKSIDIVGCKECKYAEDCEQMVVFENGKYITSGYKLDFCSYGERSE